MFVVLLKYLKPLTEVDQARPRHVEFLKAGYLKGIFIASGRQNPPSGGVILAHGLTREELEQTMLTDPFTQEGITEFSIIEFKPTMSHELFTPLLKE